ncbi:MAG: AAA family ATPase, partial [Alphaproteobacteria bacterium]|nr:AAA family ATPase [Alphaproteobacteria bacterium]
MLLTLAVSNYRSLLDLKIPLFGLNVITGPNGSGKSNLYKALRLLSETAQGGVVNAIANEGGLNSTFWAGPETLSTDMKNKRVKVQGTVKSKPPRLKLGFIGEDFGYSIELGFPQNSGYAAHNVPSSFTLDPEIKRECIWAGEFYKPSSVLIDRNGPVIKSRQGSSWNVILKNAGGFESLFSCVADPASTPEVFTLKTIINSWRFYDHFRTDSSSPARLPQLGTRTPALHHDGRDLAAALQTIIEIGDVE